MNHLLHLLSKCHFLIFYFSNHIWPSIYYHNNIDYYCNLIIRSKYYLLSCWSNCVILLIIFTSFISIFELQKYRCHYSSNDTQYTLLFHHKFHQIFCHREGSICRYWGLNLCNSREPLNNSKDSYTSHPYQSISSFMIYHLMIATFLKLVLKIN